MKKFNTAILIALIAGSFSLSAQESIEIPEESKPEQEVTGTKSWSISINGGHALFYGDLRQYDFYPVYEYESEHAFAFGGTVSKTFSRIFSLEGQLLYGQLGGTKRVVVHSSQGATALRTWLPGNGVYFRTNFLEGSINARFRISHLLFSNAGDCRFGFYAFIGHGLVRFDSQVYQLGSDEPLTAYRRGVSGQTTEAVTPLGIGMDYRISKSFDIGLRAAYRHVHSDKLDAWVSPGSANDGYGYTALNLTYNFGFVKGLGKGKTHQSWQSEEDALNEKMRSLQSRIDSMHIDSDGDGVPDFHDQEPNTPEGKKVDGAGRALDLKARAEEDAEPKPLVILPYIHFEPGSAELKASERQKLKDVVVEHLRMHPKLHLEVRGHSDSASTHEADMAISRQRAENVHNFLTAHGVPDTQIVPNEYGHTKPLTLERTEADRQRNRRVDFKILKNPKGEQMFMLSEVEPGDRSVALQRMRSVEDLPEEYRDRVVEGLEFKVQVGAVMKARGTKMDFSYLESGNLRISEEVDETYIRYVTPAYSTLNQAFEVRDQMQQSGIPDAWVVPYYNGERELNMDRIRELQEGEE